MDFARLLGTPVQAALRSVIAEFMVAPAGPDPAGADGADVGDRAGAASDEVRGGRPVAGRGALTEKPADLPPATATPAALRAAATGLPPPRLLDPAAGRLGLEAALARLAATETGDDLREEPRAPVLHQRIDTTSPTRGEHHVQSESVTVVTISLGRSDDDDRTARQGIAEASDDGARRAAAAADPPAGRPLTEAHPDRPADTAGDSLADEAAASTRQAEPDTDGARGSHRSPSLDAGPDGRNDGLRGRFDPAAALDRPTAAHAAIEPDFAMGGAIVNAAMIPGWPPPRPFATAFARQIPMDGQPEEQAVPSKLLAGLAALGVAARLIARLRRRLAALGRRPEVVIASGVLFASIMAVMDATARELEAMADEEDDRERAHGLSGRFRIDER